MSDIKKGLLNAKGGEPLGSLLSSLLKEASQKSGISQSALIESMGKEAGLQKSSVMRILQGKVKAPPLKRLEGFAHVLKNYLQ